MKRKCMIVLSLVLLSSVLQLLSGCSNTQSDVNMNFYWQAHRGGGLHEAPDNSIAAFIYAWELGGIPEVDIRTTSDNVIICMHDATLSRTCNAPAELKDVPVSDLSFEQIRQYDIGVKFSQEFKGEFVPSLEQVFKLMQDHPDRLLYMDIKDVDLPQLGKMINSFETGPQILVCSPRQDDCKTLKTLADGVRTMLWMGGSAGEIKDKFHKAKESGFDGLDQVQLHLNDKKEPAEWRYQLDFPFIQAVFKITKDSNIDLQVFPFHFKEKDLNPLFDLGIRWFVTDEPMRFSTAIENWKQSL